MYRWEELIAYLYYRLKSCIWRPKSLDLGILGLYWYGHTFLANKFFSDQSYSSNVDRSTTRRSSKLFHERPTKEYILLTYSLHRGASIHSSPDYCIPLHIASEQTGLSYTCFLYQLLFHIRPLGHGYSAVLSTVLRILLGQSGGSGFYDRSLDHEINHYLLFSALVSSCSVVF